MSRFAIEPDRETDNALSRQSADRRDRQAEIIAHNQRMLLLRSNGQAHRDRLLKARLNLRREPA